MSQLALQLIKENKEKHARGEDATRLDIGNCGLTELPDALFDCLWLEELVVSNRWGDGEMREWVESANTGKANLLKALNPKIGSLAKLRRLFIGGDIDSQ